jgi:hypothetical protein
MEDTMLTFGYSNESRAVVINCDKQGMAVLIKALERARADGDHIHLRVEPNGLDEKDLRGKPSIGEVIINWVDE